MDLNNALKKVAVLGAAGKMGSGIALLLLQEMAGLDAQSAGKPGEGGYKLVLIDSNDQALDGLRQYLKSQIVKFSEKNINILRSYYSKDPALVSNEEIIREFTQKALDLVHYHTHLDTAIGSNLIFEAIVEDIEVKSKVFTSLISNGCRDSYFFTNTSSIPISVLNDKANMQNRLIGFHFYNPPAVQKLLEIISTPKTDPHLQELADEIAKRLHKIIVHSNDVAGFIGNGQFVREISFACMKVDELAQGHTLTETIYMMDKVTRDFLIRPMGIFQLLDYVGIDVAERIARIMTAYLPDLNFHGKLIERMASMGKYGGQNPDGSQKNGFFEYEQGTPKGIYDMDKKKYIFFSEGDWAKRLDLLLGKLPEGWQPWKKLQKDPERKDKIKVYLKNLFQETSLGAELAKGELVKAREIARNLVRNGVAKSIDDVNIVMENGFFHLYGPDSPLIPQDELAVEQS